MAEISGTLWDFSDLPNGFLEKTGNISGDVYATERNLFSVLATEAYNKHGVAMTYYQVNCDTGTNNRLLGEDNDRKIQRCFNIMAFYQLPKHEQLWSKFGIEGMDNFSIFITKRHFATVSKYDSTMTSAIYPSAIPMIGDLVVPKYNNLIYEIIDRKEEQGMFLTSQQHFFELIVRPMRERKLTLSGDTSGTIAISGSIDMKQDVFDLSGIASSMNETIKYNPTTTETTPTDEFWN
jgi:hypothetical protein